MRKPAHCAGFFAAVTSDPAARKVRRKKWRGEASAGYSLIDALAARSRTATIAAPRLCRSSHSLHCYGFFGKLETEIRDQRTGEKPTSEDRGRIRRRQPFGVAVQALRRVALSLAASSGAWSHGRTPSSNARPGRMHPIVEIIPVSRRRGELPKRTATPRPKPRSMISRSGRPNPPPERARQKAL